MKQQCRRPQADIAAIGATRRTQPKMTTVEVNLLAARYGVTPWKVRHVRRKYALAHGLVPAPRGRVPRARSEWIADILVLIRLRQALTVKGIAQLMSCAPSDIANAVRRARREADRMPDAPSQVDNLLARARQSDFLRSSSDTRRKVEEIVGTMVSIRTGGVAAKSTARELSPRAHG
jgi:hypothetical protein